MEVLAKYDSFLDQHITMFVNKGSHTLYFNQSSTICEVHAFWVSKDFTLKHCLLAVEHFGTDSHTGDNILRHFKQITEEYGLISFSAPVVTDKGSNMVSGLRDSPRLDCICHRIHTVFADAYKETQRQVPEVKQYEDAVANLCKYVKQATGIQETLPVSIKHGGNTRPWTSINHRAHSIHESYTKLSEKLTERVKLPLLAAVDKELNEKIRDVTEVFNCVFENLQFNTRPTINLVIPSYYKLSAMATHEDLDSLEMTPADRKFKRNLLKDLPGWLETLAQTSSETASPLPLITEAETEEPPQKKGKSFFGTMRDKVQPVMHLGDTTLNLQQEYDIYISMVELHQIMMKKIPWPIVPQSNTAFPSWEYWLDMFYAVRPLPRNPNVTFHTPD